MNIDNGWTNNIAIDQTIMFQTPKGVAKGIPKYILFVYTESSRFNTFTRNSLKT